MSSSYRFIQAILGDDIREFDYLVGVEPLAKRRPFWGRIFTTIFNRKDIKTMNVEYTDRGFAHYTPIATQYGHVVRVYESSSAWQPSLWLKIELKEKVGGIDPEEATAHLSLDQARELRDQLDHLITNHYQLQSE